MKKSEHTSILIIELKIIRIAIFLLLHLSHLLINANFL